MNPSLSKALAERGYDTLTPVQIAVADPALIGADLLVSAQTGSGKTVGFGLAIAPTLLGEEEQFARADHPLALVIAPTRELAFQVMRELSWLYAKTGARLASCVGGMDMRDERRALERGAHIVVGTPGRLRDHIMRGSLDMTHLRVVVLDEADEMLDLGFREDLEFMLNEAPEDRRTLLFSATVPPAIAKLAKQYQTDAQRVNTIESTDQHADISYQVMKVAAADSEHAIFNLLRLHDEESAIVFANTRAAVNHLTARLANRGFNVVSLSGELSQTERTHALQAMRDGRARICVATDVAARGIDLPNLNLVVHADIPTNTEGLLHRSGRTGRAGRKGISVLIAPPKLVKKTERLLKWAKVQAEWISPPSAEDILRADEARLLEDPAWQEPATQEQQAFAEKLLARQSPESIAAAYLRLYRSRRSAPEELRPVDEKPLRQRSEFGPSQWFALSVGRDDRAEPRWLLPLLCRAGGLDKDSIGAIRVQGSETFVEIAIPAVAGFTAALGKGNELDEGINVRQLDGAPNLSAPPRKDHSKAAKAPAKHAKPKRDHKPDPLASPVKSQAEATPETESTKAKPAKKKKPFKGKPKPAGDAPHKAPKRKKPALTGKPHRSKKPNGPGKKRTGGNEAPRRRRDS